MPRFHGRMLLAVAKAMDQQNQLTIGDITIKRLSFPREGPVVPDGLRVQSGLLRRSLRATPAVVVGENVASTIGSNVKYAAIHEFGFDGVVQVGPHTRKRFERKKFIGGKGRAVTRKVRVGDINVVAHSREVHLPERKYVRGTLFDRADKYIEAFGNAIQDEFMAIGNATT